jgi:hypothetical protein
VNTIKQGNFQGMERLKINMEFMKESLKTTKNMEKVNFIMKMDCYLLGNTNIILKMVMAPFTILGGKILNNKKMN